MKQLFYKLIYNPRTNFVLRNINKTLYPILPRSLQIPPSGTIPLTVDGRKLLLHTNQTNYLTQLVFWDGYMNFEYTGIFIDLIKKLDCFLDIGANIGYYSLLASHMNPNIKVTSFEPAPGPLYYFRKNVEVNDFHNITIEPIAISHKNGEIAFYEVQNLKYKYLKYSLSGEGNTGSIIDHRDVCKNVVKTTTLDNYTISNNIKIIDLIKIDTEGTEHLILEKSDKVLTELKPIIICETLFNKIEQKIEEIMKSYHYRFFNHTPDGLCEVTSIQRNVDDNIRNCFFVPPSRIGLIENYLV